MRYVGNRLTGYKNRIRLIKNKERIKKKAQVKTRGNAFDWL